MSTIVGCLNQRILPRYYGHEILRTRPQTNILAGIDRLGFESPSPISPDDPDRTKATIS